MTSTVERLRRDAVRSVARLRNGARYLAGASQPATAPTPKDVLWRSGKVELWRYRSDETGDRTPLLFVHSLVSKAYVFDLTAGNSMVATLLAHGFDVFLVNWGEPDELEAANTLETYVDGHLPEIVEAVKRVSGRDELDLFGYCFGGVLALLHLAGHPDAGVRSLSVAATPVDSTGMAALAGFMGGGPDVEDLLDATGNIPPEVIANMFRVMQPTSGINGVVTLWQHLWNDDYVAAHQLMAGWGKDHIPFPGACFAQVADLLGARNLLATGRVPLGGRVVDLADITVPFLSVVAEHDTFVPPAATDGLADLVGSEIAEGLRLPAGHIGLFLGRTAHRHHIPAIAGWVKANGATASS